MRYPTRGVIRQVWDNIGRNNRHGKMASQFAHFFPKVKGLGIKAFPGHMAVNSLYICFTFWISRLRSNRHTYFSFLPCQFSLLLQCKVLIDIINVNGYTYRCV